MSFLRLWEILAECDGQRVVMSLVSDDLREFSYDGRLQVEREGAAACASLGREGDLFLWIDDYSEELILVNISHRVGSEHSGVPLFLCTMPLRIDQLLVRVVHDDGSVVQKWPE